MKYAHVKRNGFVAAQVLQLSDNGYIVGRAFVQADGGLGSYSNEEEDIRWEGDKTYPTEREARKSMGAQ